MPIAASIRIRIALFTGDQVVHLHKHAVRGLGNPPGQRWRPPPRLDDPGRSERILRKLQVVARMAEAQD